MLISLVERDAIIRALEFGAQRMNRDARLPAVKKEQAQINFQFSLEAQRIAAKFKGEKKITLNKTTVPVIVASLRLMVRHLFEQSEAAAPVHRKKQLLSWSESFDRLAVRIEQETAR